MAILESLLLDFSWSGRVPLIQKVILMAKMLLHFLDPEHKVNVSRLSSESGVSRQTLYQWGYQAISLIGVACVSSQTESWSADQPSDNERFEELEAQLTQLQRENQQLQQENQQLKAEVERLKGNLRQLVDKTIIVLRLSGKVSYRGITECIELIFGVLVRSYVICEKLKEASAHAEGVLPSLLASIRSRFVGIDEIYLKEKGKRIYGLLVIDLPSRVILKLERATNRTADRWAEVMAGMVSLQDSAEVIVSDLAKAFPKLVRKLSKTWKRSLGHQLCNVHAMRTLFEHRTLAYKCYRQAKARFTKAADAYQKTPNEAEKEMEYWSARQLRKFHWRQARYCSTLISQIFRALRKPTEAEANAQLELVLAKLADLPSDYKKFADKTGRFIANYRARLLFHLNVPDLAWTTNGCESTFSVFRRFMSVYKCFPNQESTERFFALFTLYYNLKPQKYSDGQFISPLARAGVKTESSYLYYLGFRAPSQIISYSKLPQRTPVIPFRPRLKVSTPPLRLAKAA